MSDFDEWLRAVCFQRPTDSVRDLAMDAWNHQQARIAELEAENQRLRDALESIDESTHDVHAARKARKALLGGGENG